MAVSFGHIKTVPRESSAEHHQQCSALLRFGAKIIRSGRVRNQHFIFEKKSKRRGFPQRELVEQSNTMGGDNGSNLQSRASGRLHVLRPDDEASSESAVSNIKAGLQHPEQSSKSEAESKGGESKQTISPFESLTPCANLLDGMSSFLGSIVSMTESPSDSEFLKVHPLLFLKAQSSLSAFQSNAPR